MIGVLTNPTNEIAILKEMLSKADLPENTNVYENKDYRSAKTEELLKRKMLNINNKTLYEAQKE